jgi:Patatin-like phospholipase
MVPTAAGGGTMTTRLRLALTLPGGVSLGAYEGGALAALLVAVQHLDGQVVIDGIASASAGSITALLAARCLLRGADPVALMTAAWVDADGLEAMRTHDVSSPLSPEVLSGLATALLGEGGVPDGPVHQPEAIRISMTLASLGGLSYQVASLERGTAVDAGTFLDWYDVTLEAASGPEAYVRAAEPALASAANALGFPPRLLDRSADEGAYRNAGILNFPATGRFWYSDGGTIDNEPLGRTIEMTTGAEAGAGAGQGERLLLLIHPDPPVPTRGGIWWDPDERPSWTRTLLRCQHIAQAQSIYDDLRQLEKVNSRLRWSALLSEALARGLEEGLSGLAADDQAAVRSAVAAALAGALDQVERDRAAIHRLEERDVPEPAARAALGAALAPGDDLGGAFTALLRLATGLAGKRTVHVDVVSPLIDAAAGPSAEDQLAGEFLFHFGGFLDRRFRQSDFALGYRNLRTWLGPGLRRAGIDPDGALAAVDGAYDKLGWGDIRYGDASLGRLSLGQKGELALLAGHVAHIVVHDLAHWQGD